MEAFSADLRRLRQEYDLDEAGVKRKVIQAWYKVICPRGRLSARRLEMMRAEKAWIEDFEVMDDGYAMWYSGLPPKALEADDQAQQGVDVLDHVLSVPSRHCSSPCSGSSSSSLFEIVPGNPVLGTEFKEWSPLTGLGRLVKQPEQVISDSNSDRDSQDSCVTSDSAACRLTANWSSSESSKWKELSSVLGELIQEVQDQEVLLDSMAAGGGDAKTETGGTRGGIEAGKKKQPVEGSAGAVEDKVAAVCQDKEVVEGRKLEAEQEAVPSTGALDEVLKRLESVEGALQTQQVVVVSKGRALKSAGLLLLFITGIILFLLSSSGVRRGTVLPT